MEEKKVRGAKHKEATAARGNEQKELTAEYHKLRNSIALADLMAKAKTFAQYHAQVATDGVAYEQTVSIAGNVQTVVRLNHDDRVSHMDKAAGIQEIIDYLERKLTMEPAKKDK